MTRLNRLAIPLALLLVVAFAAIALASRPADPSARNLTAGASDEADPAEGVEAQDEADEADDADGIEHAAERLRDKGYDDAQLASLAERYGIGGAVRLIAWAADTGRTTDEIAAMRDGADGSAPMGWGQIAKELGVKPGIGSIMGQGRAGDDDEAVTPDS